MKSLDEILYDAITADETLTALTGGRVVSTCFEVPPDEEDNTPLPNIIIVNNGFQNQATTKDNLWESCEDRVVATVDIAATSPAEVIRIVKLVRKAIETHIASIYANGNDIPYLDSLSGSDIAWDWMKPCYHQVLTYQCITQSDLEDEQEETT